MKKLLFLLLISVSLVVACAKDEDIQGTVPVPPIEDTTTQTLFVYMPWTVDLTHYLDANIADIERAIKSNILKKSRILVFFMTSSTQATLFELTNEGGKSVRTVFKSYSFSSPDYTTAEGLAAILNDVLTYAPADRYAMVISSHGMGWIPVDTSLPRISRQKWHWECEGEVQTRFFGGSTRLYQSDITVLSEALTDVGVKMEYILFDACYMSNIEVAYDLRKVTDYLILSPTEIIASGMPYGSIMRYMVGDVNYDRICKGFFFFYSTYIAMPCGTIATIDCSELDELAVLMKEVNGKFVFDNSKINDIQRMCGYTPTIFFDFGDYVDKLCDDPELLARFQEQLDKVIPYEEHTANYYSMEVGPLPIRAYSGLAISDPSTNPTTSAKTETAWYKATH